MHMEYERSYLRKALSHPSWEGFDNLAFIKLQHFSYLLCQAVKRAGWCKRKQRANRRQLLTPVCTGKYNTNCGHAAAVVGGNGGKDVAGRKWQLGIQKKKAIGIGNKQVGAGIKATVRSLRRQEPVQALLSKSIGRGTWRGDKKETSRENISCNWKANTKGKVLLHQSCAA